MYTKKDNMKNVMIIFSLSSLTVEQRKINATITNLFESIKKIILYSGFLYYRIVTKVGNKNLSLGILIDLLIHSCFHSILFFNIYYK